MLILSLGLALAGEVEVDVGTKLVVVQLDGERLDFAPGTRSAVGSGVGAHRVTVQSWFGRPVASLDLELPERGTTRLRLDGDALVVVDRAVPPPPEPPHVPEDARRYGLSSGQFYVPFRAAAGGETHEALVDTGATEVSMCGAVATGAGFVAREEVPSVSGTHQMHVLIRGTVPQVAVFGHTVDRVPAVVHDSCDYLLVGARLLSRFNAVFAGDDLYVWSGPPLVHPTPPLPLASTGVYAVEVHAEGASARLTVDTGMYTTALWRGAVERLGGQDTGETRTIQVSVGIVTLPVYRLPTLTVAGRTLTDVEVLMVDEPSPYADGMLGVNVLRELELWVSPRGAWLFAAGASGLALP